MYVEEGSYSYVARYIMMVPTDVVISVAEVFNDGSSAEATPEAEVVPDAEVQSSEGVDVSTLSEGDTFASQMVELADKAIENATSSKGRGGIVNAVTTYSDGTTLSFTKEAGAAEYKLVGVE